VRLLGPLTATWLITAALPVLAQDFEDIKVERAAGRLLFADGPAWIREGSREGWLLFSDVPADRIMKLAPGEGVESYREQSNGAAGNTFDSQGRLYTCETHARRVTRTDKKGKVDVLADKFEGKRLNAPNDIAVRHDYQVYFTDPAFGNQLETRELDFFGVYHVTPKGDLEVIARPKGRPNGVALSPDGKTLYITNSDEKNVRAYDLDKNGAASNERIVISGIEGVPDGIRTDERGNLYVAAKGVQIYTGQGKLIRQILMSEKPSNLAFGDADMQSLYVTARTSVYRLRVPVKGW
jgi:gluconolactonase